MDLLAPSLPHLYEVPTLSIRFHSRCRGRGDLAVHQIIFPPDPATSSNKKLGEFLQLQTKIGHWY